eukprot:3647936-Pyramimonas_sp.AAC.1
MVRLRGLRALGRLQRQASVPSSWCQTLQSLGAAFAFLTPTVAEACSAVSTKLADLGVQSDLRDVRQRFGQWVDEHAASGSGALHAFTK